MSKLVLALDRLHESLKKLQKAGEEENGSTGVWLSQTSWNVALQVGCAGLTLFCNFAGFQFKKFLKTLNNDAVDSRTTYVIHFLDDVLKTSVNTGLIYKCLHFKTLMGMDYLKTSW